MAAKPLALVGLLLMAALLAGCASPGPSGPNTTSPSPGPSPSPGTSPSPSNGTSGNASGPATELAVATSGQYPVNPGFAPATLSAKAGQTIHLTFTNADQLPAPLITHAWSLEGVSGATTKEVNPGEKADVTFVAPKAGTYKYFCPVGDHRARGMEGTLTVT